MEFLHQSGHSNSSIANYMTVIRAFHIIHGFPIYSFRDERIQLYLKALKNAAPRQPYIRPTLDVSVLNSLILFCETTQHPLVFKALYLVSFFLFLRLSNLLPHSLSLFDSTRQLACGDMDMPWNQPRYCYGSGQKPYRIGSQFPPFHSLISGESTLCPIQPLTTMIQAYHASKNDPLFVTAKNSQPVPLTDSLAHKHLKKASSVFNISPPLTFHAFRREGASWAFSHGVPLEHIMRHGTWHSNAIWTYLSSSPSTIATVSAAFQAALHS